MVTELKTEQLAVTALGGEITPALLAPGHGLRREKSGETETKRCKYLHNRGLYSKNVGPE